MPTSFAPPLIINDSSCPPLSSPGAPEVNNAAVLVGVFLAISVAVIVALVAWAALVLRGQHNTRLVLARSLPLAAMYSFSFLAMTALALLLSLTSEMGRAAPCWLVPFLWLVCHAGFSLSTLMIMLIKELFFATYAQLAHSFDARDALLTSSVDFGDMLTRSSWSSFETPKRSDSKWQMVKTVLGFIFFSESSLFLHTRHLRPIASFVAGASGVASQNHTPVSPRSPRPSAIEAHNSPRISMTMGPTMGPTLTPTKSGGQWNVGSTRTLNTADSRQLSELERLDKSLWQQQLSPDVFARFSSALSNNQDGDVGAHHHHASPGVHLDRVSAFIGSEEDALRLYAFATTPWVLFLQWLAFASPGMLAFIVIFFSAPLYSHGCTGCIVYLDLIIALVVTCGLVYGLALARLFFLLHGHADGFRVVRDVKAALAVNVVCYITCFACIVVDPLNWYQTGQVSWEWIALVGTTIGWAIMVPSPVLVVARASLRKSNDKTSSKMSKNQLAALERAFDMPAIRDRFEHYCARNYCVENFRFIEAVRNWRFYYAEKSRDWRCAKSKTIFTMYLATDAALQCNVSFSTKNDVELALEAAAQKGQSVPVTVFDTALREVMQMLAHGVWNAFEVDLQKDALHRNQLSRRSSLMDIMM